MVKITPPLTAFASRLPLRPRLIGSLVTQSVNMWLGASRAPTSSGLHHDYHDNMYVLLRGKKEFKLFSPRCVDLLRTAGATSCRPTLHANGLICYGPGLREDGALCSRARKAKASNQQKTKMKEGWHKPPGLDIFERPVAAPHG